MKASASPVGPGIGGDEPIADGASLRRSLALPPGPPLPGTVPACLVPRSFVRRMRPGDPLDPLLLQVLPDPREAGRSAGEAEDPLGEAVAAIVPGVLQRFTGRALVLVSDRCALRCRFCFRRHRRVAVATLATALPALRQRPDLREVILSGGDPLMLPVGELHAWLEALADLPGLRRLRIHTRLPVAVPEQVDPTLMTVLGSCRLPLTMVVHANHPAEFDASVQTACTRLRQAGVVLLGQSVLLAGINDDPLVLAELAERQGDCGVVPYYLHCLDAAAGTAHFAVSDQRALALQTALRERLPGHLVPRLVRDRPDAPAKEAPDLSGQSC